MKLVGFQLVYIRTFLDFVSQKRLIFKMKQINTFPISLHVIPTETSPLQKVDQLYLKV